jgi:hypothetical protein
MKQTSLAGNEKEVKILGHYFIEVISSNSKS